MDKKIQQSVLKYIKKAREVPRSQVITVISDRNLEKRILIQEVINLLLDADLISIVGADDTLALTNKGHKHLGPWYRRINWQHHTLKIAKYIIVFLLGLFATEIKNLILNFFK